MSSIPQVIVVIFLIMVFISGIIVILTDGIRNPGLQEGLDTKIDAKSVEPAVNADKNTCPDMLLKKGNSFLLFNSTAPRIEGINPLPFFSMDEYINYLEIQRKDGIRCPVLFMQMENDTQGNDIYRMHPSPFYIEGGIPPISIVKNDNSIPAKFEDANLLNPPYNQDMYPGFDAHAMDVGRITNIDVIHNSTSAAICSANAADSNWCGPSFTNAAIERGEYSGNNVSSAIYPNVHPK